MALAPTQVTTSKALTSNSNVVMRRVTPSAASAPSARPTTAGCRAVRIASATTRRGSAPRADRGRLFTRDEYEAGTDRVVLLTHGFWLQRYDADPEVIGTTIDLEGSVGLTDSNGRYTVVGILPPDFWHFYDRGEIVLPLRASVSQMTDRRSRLVERVIGRLPEATPQQAQAELTSMTGRLEREHLGTDSGRSVGATPA